MTVDLGWLATETQRLKLAARRVHRQACELRDMQARELDRLELPAGPLDERAVIDFLRRAVSTTREGVVITVSQPTQGPDSKEQPNGPDL